MASLIVDSADPVSLIGGGEVTRADLAEALSLAGFLVAADGGAATALEAGHVPHHTIGDMDSLTEHTMSCLPPDRLHHVAEQDSTDFDKALRHIRAPMVLGIGLLGGRLDHQLANLNVLVRRHSPPCILLGQEDIAFAAPAAKTITLSLPPRSRVSLFPLAPVTGKSTGLHWPIDGLTLAPDATIGTSNRVADDTEQITLHTHVPGLIVILPRAALQQALAALMPVQPSAPAR